MRFTGCCEPITSVDVAGLVDWIGNIDFLEWPQQGRPDQELRPAMVTDLSWHGFREMTDPVVARIKGLFPECWSDNRMLSVVMPGHSIEPHCDWQSPAWRFRVHVPLTTNEQSLFIVGGEHHVMKVGMAYRVNTEVEHSVENKGNTPRIHFMFDVRANA